MERAAGKCSFCHREADFRPLPALPICESCAARIAVLAAETTAQIWEDDDGSPRNASKSPPTREDEDRRAEALDRDAKNIREATPLTKEDAKAHYDLARAYVDMNLFPDARLTLAVAIAPRPTNDITAPALTLLLSEPLLTPAGLARLRERLNRVLH